MCRDYDSISLESIEEMIMRREKQLYLNQHKNEIWQGKNGHRISKKMFYEYLVKACEAIDIPKRSMHKIRRTYATMLIDANVEDSLIMEQMGHSDISTTRKYYYYCNKDNAYKRDQIQNAIKFNQV